MFLRNKGLRISICVVMTAVAVVILNACGGGVGVEPVNKTTAGLALRGYDAVAYFRDGKPVQGRDEFRHEWKGARWLFASSEARDEFARKPEAYAPQYGGYCSWAVSHGYTADGDPEAWKIVDGKLYLNYNREVREMWEKEIPSLINKGNENWPRLLERGPEKKSDGQ